MGLKSVFQIPTFELFFYFFHSSTVSREYRPNNEIFKKRNWRMKELWIFYWKRAFFCTFTSLRILFDILTYDFFEINFRYIFYNIQSMFHNFVEKYRIGYFLCGNHLKIGCRVNLTRYAWLRWVNAMIKIHFAKIRTMSYFLELFRSFSETYNNLKLMHLLVAIFILSCFRNFLFSNQSQPWLARNSFDENQVGTNV